MINLTETSKKLKAVGLGRDEALVYGHLLEQGRAKSLAIQRATGLTKPLTYRALHELAERGLVTQTKRPGSVTEFSPADPRNIEEHFAQESRALQQNRAVFESMLPGFLGQFMSHIDRPTMRYEDTLEGVVNLFIAANNSGTKIYQYIDPILFDKPFLVEATRRVQSHRLGVGTHKVLLYPDVPAAQEHIRRDPDIEQYISSAIPAFPVCLLVYDTTVVLISVKDELSVVGYAISDKVLCDFMLSMFQVVWKLAEARPVQSGQ